MNRFMRKCVMDRKIVLHLIQNKSFNKISKLLKVSKTRVKKVKALAEKHGYLSGTELPSFPAPLFSYELASNSLAVSDVDAELLEHKEWIKERRGLGWHFVTIHEELPVKVSSSSFYRFIKRHKIDVDFSNSKARQKVVGEIIHAPGEALILDWGKLRDVIDPVTGKKKTVWFLAGVLGHSRYMMVRLVWDNKTETTLRAIESMFNEIGGVPKKIISDNPKCFSLIASDYEPLLNPAFARFCSHYKTTPEILPPYDPVKKGKIERLVPFTRRIFESYGEWSEINIAQEFMDEKVKIANKRTHGTTKRRPCDVFLAEEANELSILPGIDFKIEQYAQGKVRADGHVRFKNKYYSLDKKHIGSEVFIIGDDQVVSIYFNGLLLETHQVVKNPAQSKSTKKHHLEPYEQIMTDGQYYLKKARDIGVHTEKLIEAILLSGQGFVDTRKVWGILSLDKSNSKERIDDACKMALECNLLGYRSVLSFLNLKPEDKSEIKKSSENKFIRDINEYNEQLGKYLH
jgi:hypothetical protein